MKYVHTSDMVAHLFANQSQPEARNSGDYYYFNLPSIYSFGSHFEIARHVEFKGKHCVLFTQRTCGQRTSKHLSDTWRALRGQLVFDVPECGSSHAQVVENYLQKQIDEMVKATRARIHADWHLGAARSIAEQANAYIDFFELDAPHLSTVIDPETLASARAKADNFSEARKAAVKKRAEEREEQEEKELAEWLAGTRHSLPWNQRQRKCFMRVKGDIVQTSQGAEFPVSHAKRIFKVIARCVKSGVPYQKNGHSEKVGLFEVDSISTDGTVRAGCHTILPDEIERIAKLIGATA